MSNSTTVDGGTVLSIPAGKTWQGCLSLAATLAVSVGGAAATRFPKITISGTGGNIDNGDTLVSLALFVPAVGATALTGSLTTDSLAVGPIQIQARDNPITLILTLGSGVTGVATAAGEIF